MEDLQTLRKKIVRYRRLADFAGDARTGQIISTFVAELEAQADELAREVESRTSMSKPGD